MTEAIVLPLQPADRKFTTSVVAVDPDTAQRWLLKNRKNRHLRPSVVTRYAKDMQAGEWRSTGEAVKFDWDGNLVDGQHRLNAIVKAGVTVPLLVVRGLDPAAQEVMDTGAKRSAGDALGLHGRPHGVLLAAGARLALAYNAGALKTTGTHDSAIHSASNAEIIRFVDNNPDLEEAAAAASSFAGKITARPSVIALAFLILSRIDADGASDFFASLAEYRTNGTGDPRLALLRRLQLAKQSREKLTVAAELHYIFRAWNAVRSGKSLEKFATPANGQVAVPR